MKTVRMTLFELSISLVYEAIIQPIIATTFPFISVTVPFVSFYILRYYYMGKVE